MKRFKIIAKLKLNYFSNYLQKIYSLFIDFTFFPYFVLFFLFCSTIFPLVTCQVFFAFFNVHSGWVEPKKLNRRSVKLNENKFNLERGKKLNLNLRRFFVDQTINKMSLILFLICHLLTECNLMCIVRQNQGVMHQNFAVWKLF